MSVPNAGDEVERLAELVRRGAESGFGDSEKRYLRASFLGRADGELARVEARGRRALPWLLPAVAVALALVVWIFSPRSLDFEVQGAPRDGAYVRAPSDRPATVRFSDRTTVVAASGSRLRVEQASGSRVRVLVERGRADVHVVHDAQRDWTFVAGPFEVLVTGTRFVLDWDPLAETFELSLTEGSVEVRGPTGSGPIAVRAGERFSGDAQRKSMVLSPSAALPSAPGAARGEASSSPAAPPPSAGPERKAPAGAPQEVRAARGIGPTSDWQERMTRGEFAIIVGEAEARGVAQCLSQCGAPDLRALSDAARYTGKTKLAEQSLLALHQRYGGGPGRDAAFSLGRLFEQRGQLGEAERWYDTYLREAPAGAFAAEALAGKMRAVEKLRGAPAAAPLARDYLKRFPKGVHGATARDIIGED